MNSDPQRMTAMWRAAMPHPGVLVAALLLALAGAWCGLPGHAADESAAATSILRQDAAHAKTQYMRTARQVLAAKSRLRAAQDRLERFTRQQYDELYRAAANGGAEGAATDSQNLNERNDRAESERLAQRVADLSQQRSQLLERLTPEHPMVRDVDSQMADVQRMIAALANSADPGRQSSAADGPSGDRLRQHWRGLVDEAVANWNPIEQECRQIEQELVTAEARRGGRKKLYDKFRRGRGGRRSRIARAAVPGLGIGPFRLCHRFAARGDCGPSGDRLGRPGDSPNRRNRARVPFACCRLDWHRRRQRG